MVASIVDRTGAQIDPLPRDRVGVEDDGTFRLRGVFGHRTLTVVGMTLEHVLDRVLQGNAEIKMLTLSPRELVDKVTLVVRRRN